MAVAVGVGVAVAPTVPVAVVGVVATLAASDSKNTTTSNLRALPVPHGAELRCAVSVPSVETVDA